MYRNVKWGWRGLKDTYPYRMIQKGLPEEMAFKTSVERGEEGRWAGKDWELGISRCKLVYIGWINYKVLLYSAGKYIQ